MSEYRSMLYVIVKVPPLYFWEGALFSSFFSCPTVIGRVDRAADRNAPLTRKKRGKRDPGRDLRWEKAEIGRRSSHGRVE